MQPWQPTANLKNLRLRAALLAKVRAFFAKRDVLEVETPLLAKATVTDIHLQSFVTEYHPAKNSASVFLYLQTSPEFAMKRLLAAGCGSIFQICKAFRNEGEYGRLHNPEFTLLEWYRIGFNHHALMNEVDQFFKDVLDLNPAKRFSYAELFFEYLGINPHIASIEDLKNRAVALGLQQLTHLNVDDKDCWLQLLMSHYIEPKLEQLTFVYDFPRTQAALARLSQNNPLVAERFEVYFQGVELANGFHELTNAQEQLQRFRNDLSHREKNNYPLVPIDDSLINALQHGLPDCAGIALGIDRLVMLAAKTERLAEVICFPIERA